MALSLSGFSAALVGIDGFKLGVFAAGLKLNQAKDTDANPNTNPAKLDWTTFFNGATGLTPASIPQVDASVEIEAQGTLVLDAFGVVIVKGSFKLQLGTVTKDGTIYQAMALTLGSTAFSGASAVEVFIGVGGALQDPSTPLNYADDTLNLDSGIGFYASLNSLSLVTLKNNNATPTQANDDKSYMALSLSGFSASLVG